MVCKIDCAAIAEDIKSYEVNMQQALTHPFKGFSRVIINEHGETWTMLKVIQNGRDAPVVGFMRDDGWTLGTPHQFEWVGFRLFEKQWTHFIRMPSMVWLPISEYNRPD
jgi:hypothetical protein